MASKKDTTKKQKKITEDKTLSLETPKPVKKKTPEKKAEIKNEETKEPLKNKRQNKKTEEIKFESITADVISETHEETKDKPDKKKSKEKKIAEPDVTLEKTDASDDKNILGDDPLGIGKIIEESEKEKNKRKFRKKDRENTLLEVKRYDPDVDTGLTIDDVEIRQAAGLVNHTKIGSTKSIGAILANNLLSFFNFLMVGIFVWQITVNAPVLNLFFMIPVLANITIGIIQEIKAKMTIDKLSLLTAPVVNVIREKEEMEVTLNDIVIDDIILLNGGKQIPADCIVRNGLIEVNESLLTGEGDPIIKKSGDVLYSGSYVVSGYCQAQATAVGKDIYINSLTEKAKVYKRPKSSLLSSIRILMVVIGVIIIPLGILLFWSMDQHGMQYQEIAVKVSGALVGMIPAGLVLLTSIALSIGVIRLSQNNTLVQELYCIEMLARVDTLCLDKTGTITDGTMTVKGILEYKNPSALTIKQIIPAMINAQQDNNLTNMALIERFGTAKRIRHTNLIPFSSSRKFSAVQFEKYGTFVLGAPEYVIKENYDLIERDVEKQALEGYRVIVLGYSGGSITDNQKISGTVVPIGIIMIEDTIRPDAIQTIQYFKDSNVDVKVISGDNPLTASRVAERAGITNADKFISLEGLTDKEVIRAAEKYQVFGRVSPHQKMILIQSLKNQGRTVAMTGDGVNDILALREADCSIAMASGSEAATNVSHLVLLDSNFSSMPKVVSEGRRVINNVQKVATLFITKTLFSVILSIIGIVKGFYPIETRQLMMIEYFIIAIPSFILSIETNNEQVKGNFLWNVIKKSLPGALVVAISSLIVYALESTLNMVYDYDGAVISSHATTTLIVLSATFTCLGVLYNVCRPFTTRRKWLFAIVVLLCLAMSIATPNLFDFRPFFHFPNYTGTPASVPLETPQILLLLVLVQAAYPLMYVISMIPIWIKKFVKWLLAKIGSFE